MKLFSKMLLPLVLVFAGTTVFIVAAQSLWQQYHIDMRVLLGADILFLLVSIIVFGMQAKARSNPNPNVFVRSIIAGMIIKMFSTAGAVLLYATLSGAAFDSTAVFISLFIYLLYLAAEVIAISKLNKKKDAQNRV